jgi:hypothetical protein
MLPKICRCGITCRFWRGDVCVCPRCRVVYVASPTGLKTITGKHGEALVEEVEKFITEAITVFMPEYVDDPQQRKLPFSVDDKPKPIPAAHTTPESALQKPVVPCDLCGGDIDDKCGAVCKNCGWIKPCSLE